MDQNSQNFVLINNSRTAWPTQIVMLFLSSLVNLLKDAYINFLKGVDNLEIEHKTCLFLVRSIYPPGPLYLNVHVR